MSNFTPFLSQLGYDAMERGILLSGYAITTILFQLLFGVLADRYQTIKKIVIISISIFALCSTYLFFQTGMMFFIHLLLMALSGGLLNTLCGLYDTWVLSSSKELAQRLSFIKAFGSIGWAIGSMLAAYLIAYFRYQGMGLGIFVILLLAIWNMKQLPDMEKIERKKKTSLKEVSLLLQDRAYMLLIIILFLLYSMVIANNCTVIDKMLSLGATQAEISLKWSLQSLLEIPTYVLGVRVLRRFDHLRLLQFSAGMLIIQFSLFALVDSVWLMIALSIFQLFSTPLLMITSKTLIQQIAKPEVRGSAQLVALSLFTGLSSLLIPSLAGSFSMMVGIDLTLCSVTLFGIIGFVLIVLLKKRYSVSSRIN